MTPYRADPIGNSFSTDKSDEISIIEQAFVVFALLLFLGLVRDLLPGGGGDTDDRSGGSKYFQLISGCTYLSGIALLLWRGMSPSAFRLLLTAWPLVVLTGLPLLSTIWSHDPGTTLRRAIALALGSSFAFYLAVTLRPRTIFNLLVIACGIFLSVNILAVAAGKGITGGGAYAGAWQGLTGNKNDFGRSVALIAVLMFTVAALGLVTYRKTALAVASASLMLVLLSRSATSFVSMVASLGGGLLIYVLCGGPILGVRFRGGVRAVLAVMVVAVSVLLLAFMVPLLLEALGRDPTLTGRTALWEWVLAKSEDSWLLGSGYRAFWIDENTKYFFLDFAWRADPDGVLSDSYAGPTHAHSGYVDTQIELGVVGSSLYLIFIISSLRMISSNIRNGCLAMGYLFSTVIAFVSLYSITARSILQQADDLWFIVILLYLLCAKIHVGGSAGSGPLAQDLRRTNEAALAPGTMSFGRPKGGAVSS